LQYLSILEPQFNSKFRKISNFSPLKNDKKNLAAGQGRSENTWGRGGSKMSLEIACCRKIVILPFCRKRVIGVGITYGSKERIGESEDFSDMHH
jgi:hypothetical protein